ncbi:Uncharacterised protein [Vibrio cholerae]|nr:Uncharacterised protein [Vibrio cholerae]
MSIRQADMLCCLPHCCNNRSMALLPRSKTSTLCRIVTTRQAMEA